MADTITAVRVAPRRPAARRRARSRGTAGCRRARDARHHRASSRSSPRSCSARRRRGIGGPPGLGLHAPSTRSGTDTLGRDMLARTLVATRPTVLMAAHRDGALGASSGSRSGIGVWLAPRRVREFGLRRDRVRRQLPDNARRDHRRRDPRSGRRAGRRGHRRGEHGRASPASRRTSPRRSRRASTSRPPG